MSSGYTSIASKNHEIAILIHETVDSLQMQAEMAADRRGRHAENCEQVLIKAPRPAIDESGEPGNSDAPPSTRNERREVRGTRAAAICAGRVPRDWRTTERPLARRYKCGWRIGAPDDCQAG